MSSNTQTKPPVTKTEAQWRTELTPEQYHVTREHGTERAFTGPAWDEKRSGTYRCVCCGKPLFSSETKFDSGTGWPSFWAPLDTAAVSEHDDRSWFSRRTEVEARHAAAIPSECGRVANTAIETASDSRDLIYPARRAGAQRTAVRLEREEVVGVAV